MAKYRLLKDLPIIKAGAIFIPVSALAYGYEHNSHKLYHIEYAKEFVENNKEWFEQVKGRIEVSKIGLIEDRSFGGVYKFEVTNQIHYDKFPLIKEAIEGCLNTDPKGNDDLVNEAVKKWNDTYSEVLLKINPPFNAPTNSINKEESNPERTFTLQEVEEAFNESRLTHPTIGFKHLTFEDYKKTIL